MEHEELSSVIDDISYLAERQDSTKIRTVLVSAQPADVAEIIGNLDEEPRAYVFGLLDADLASDVLTELDDFTRSQLVPELKDERLSEIVDEMPSDEAAEVVADLPEDVAETILSSIDAEDSAEVRQLLLHEEETAGRIMQLELVSVRGDWTVDRAIDELRQRADEAERLYNVYVTDETGVLQGVVSLKRLLLASPGTRVSEIMTTDVISAPVDLDQEAVAQIFKRYNLVALPVVDHARRLLGRVTVDDALSVLEDEASEDIHRMAGLDPEEEYRETSALRASRARIPWLMVGLVGELVSALVLAGHMATLERVVALAFFVPVVMAMGGNSAFQSSTIVIRGLAIGELSGRHVGMRLLKELRVGCLNGIFCGAILLVVVGLWLSWRTGLVIASTLLVVIVVAAVNGAVVPLILHRLRVDPSLATGPFITTANDIIGLTIYLGIATVFA